jgi:type IV pilus assembly protein PilC
MNYETLAFFNQQLGTMLRDGIPLEGALQQLCANMQRGGLRSEMEKLADDLKAGTPLNTALTARNLPPFYKQMIRVGVQANDLPGMLLMLADYYRQVDAVLTRLKGLLVYPLLVLCAALGLSCFLTATYQKLWGADSLFSMGANAQSAFVVAVWGPPLVIGLALVLVVSVLAVPALTRQLRWRVPAFKDAKLAQVASTMSLMLKSGGNLDDALGLVQRMETGTPASRELAQWQSRLAGGRGKFTEMAAPGDAFPPMFHWLVANAGEDLAAGFARAADMYSAQAAYRIHLFLHALMPFSILALGAMIACQVIPVARTLYSWMFFMD